MAKVMEFQLQHQSFQWIFRTDLLAVQGTLKSLLQHHSSKASILWCSAFFFFFFSEAQGPVGALFNTTLFQYKQSRKKSRPSGGGVLGTVVCGARKSSPRHRWGAQAASGMGRWHQGWHSAWPTAETCRSVGGAQLSL